MARLTYQQRKRLRGSQFAEPERRKYPIEDEAHARNALSRVSRFGTSREKAEVRSAVHRKYPGMKCSMCGSRHHRTHEHHEMGHHHSGGRDPPPSMEIGMHLQAIPDHVGEHLGNWHMHGKSIDKALEQHLGKKRDEFSLSVPDSKEFEL